VDIDQDAEPSVRNALFEQVRRHTGIAMNERKWTMLKGRLRRRIMALGLPDYRDYLRVLDASAEEVRDFIDLVTTNETSFFRTPRIWEYLAREFLPQWAAKPTGQILRVWSAAASSGEEAWTTAMLCEEYRLSYPALRYAIVGTDISDGILANARGGHYGGRSMEGLCQQKPQLVQKYFCSDATGIGVSEALRAHVTFRRHNLYDVPPRQNVSFKVSGTALALSMDAIQEIIRVPSLQHSPLADEVCIGMLNLRGATVPVLDFGAFLGFARASAEEARGDERRIVVLHRNDLHFGLLVDEVESIVAYRDEELLSMPTYGGNARRSLFAGYLAAEGRAGVLLVNADALFGNERIVALASGHRELYRNVLAQAQATQRRGAGARQTLVTFRIGQLIGVRIAELREVIDYRDDIVRTPGLPPFVRGMLNLRGVLVTVIDVRAMYGMPPYEDLAHAKMLIVEHEKEKYGLLVDSVEDIVTLNGAPHLAMPSALTRGEGMRGHNDMREAVELPGQGTLLLLDPASLCARVAEVAAV